MTMRIRLGLEAALSHEARVVPLSNAFGQVTGLPTWLIFGITWQSLHIQSPERRAPHRCIEAESLRGRGPGGCVFKISPGAQIKAL